MAARKRPNRQTPVDESGLATSASGTPNSEKWPKRRSATRPPRAKKQKRNENKATLKRITTKLSTQLQRALPDNIALPLFRDLPQTWAHFLDQYGRCDQNLSDIACPPCFNGYGFMAPPEAYNEAKRAAEAKRISMQKKWRQSSFFCGILEPLIEKFHLSGLSVSIVDGTRQLIKYRIGLDMDVISRNASLDGHALLSNGLFVLLDAGRDWRTIYNPLVHGPPFIKFYAGMPLVSKSTNCAIGVLAVFDHYPRTTVSAQFQETLELVSQEIMAFLDSSPPVLSPRIESADNTIASPVSVGTQSNVSRQVTTVENEGIPGLLPRTYDVKCDMSTVKRLNCNPVVMQSYQISRELLSCLNAKGAIEKACKILASSLALDICYVVEVRATLTYKSARDWTPVPSGTKLKRLSGLENALGPEVRRSIHVRLLGGCGVDKDEQFDNEVHFLALSSKYGVQYDAPDEKMSHRSGIFMPFQQEYEICYSDNAIDHEHMPDGEQDGQMTKASSSPGGNIFRRFANMNIHDDTALIKVRHGGYVMAGLGVLHHSFSPGDVEYMKTCVKGLDNILA